MILIVSQNIPVSYIEFNLDPILSVFPVVNQFYQTDGENEYVIRGNSAILKCKVPSFIADFVFVEAWIDSDGNEYHYDSEELG